MKSISHSLFRTFAVFVLTLFINNDAFACYGLTINGPNQVCLNSQYQYTINIPQELTCTQLNQTNWRLITNLNGTYGYAEFVSPGTGTTAGLEVICPSADCVSMYSTLVKTGGSYGYVELQVQGTCALGSATNSYGITIGLAPPINVWGPAIGCSGGSYTFQADQVPGAFSYTWQVPNSSWLVNGQPGPLVTRPAAYPPPGPGTNGYFAVITPGSTPVGVNQVKVRANLSQCNGISFTPVSFQLINQVPGPPEYVSFSTHCYPGDLAISLPAVTGATGYNLILKDAYNNTIENLGAYGALTSTPYFDIDVPPPGYYTAYITSTNPCGSSTIYEIGYSTQTCGGGGEEESFKVSPNPTNESLEINLITESPEKAKSNNSDVRVEIYRHGDIELVYDVTKNARNFFVDTKSIPSGNYVVRITSVNKTLLKHIVIKH